MFFTCGSRGTYAEEGQSHVFVVRTPCSVPCSVRYFNYMYCSAHGVKFEIGVSFHLSIQVLNFHSVKSHQGHRGRERFSKDDM